MILTREQIDATYPGPLRDTARAYHDLRDAVQAERDEHIDWLNDVCEALGDWAEDDDVAQEAIILDAVRRLVVRHNDLRDAVLGDVKWVTTHGPEVVPEWLTLRLGRSAYALGYHDGVARIGEVVARVERGE